MLVEGQHQQQMGVCMSNMSDMSHARALEHIDGASMEQIQEMMAHMVQRVCLFDGCASHLEDALHDVVKFLENEKDGK